MTNVKLVDINTLQTINNNITSENFVNNDDNSIKQNIEKIISDEYKLDQLFKDATENNLEKLCLYILYKLSDSEEQKQSLVERNIHYIVYNDMLDIVKFYSQIKAGANVNINPLHLKIKEGENNTILHLAARYNAINITLFLMDLPLCNFDTSNSKGETFFHLAIKKTPSSIEKIPYPKKAEYNYVKAILDKARDISQKASQEVASNNNGKIINSSLAGRILKFDSKNIYKEISKPAYYAGYWYNEEDQIEQKKLFSKSILTNYIFSDIDKEKQQIEKLIKARRLENRHDEKKCNSHRRKASNQFLKQSGTNFAGFVICSAATTVAVCTMKYLLSNCVFLFLMPFLPAGIAAIAALGVIAFICGLIALTSFVNTFIHISDAIIIRNEWDLRNVGLTKEETYKSKLEEERDVGNATSQKRLSEASITNF